MSGGADGSSLLLSDLAEGRHDVAPKSAPVGVQWELRIYNYAHFRSQEAVGGATPAEIYVGPPARHLDALAPPRGRPGELPMVLPFRIEYLDAERLLPVLAPKDARRAGTPGKRRPAGARTEAS